MKLVLRFALIGTMMLGFGQGAAACKLSPAASDLRLFLADRKPLQVVFVARVERLEAFDGGAGVRSAQRITFRATAWWRGASRQIVNAVGFVEEPRGTSCDGVFDFAVKANEEWLIVGTEEGGVVRPSHLLSVRLQQSMLPPEVLDALKNAQ